VLLNCRQNKICFLQLIQALSLWLPRSQDVTAGELGCMGVDVVVRMAEASVISGGGKEVEATQVG
jgi:hypothetical protein